MTIVAGVDFGTQSVRFSIFHSERGRLGFGIASYPTYRRDDDPDFATQRHTDHIQALVAAAHEAIGTAGVDGRSIAAMAIDTTGSTVVPVDENLEPLDDYYLWCDHRGWREAAEITRAAREQNLEALKWCGDNYQAEFGWAKLWHWLRHNPDKRSRFATALEHCDRIAAVLCGITDLDKLPRSICALGHKWLWNESLGGLPPDSFFAKLDPNLTCVRDSFRGRPATSTALAGELSEHWAQKLGLKPGISIPVGALDAHWDAVGAGIALGDIVNVIGTSTCVMAITEKTKVVPGVSGVVPGSIHPGFVGIEAGLSAVGDVFESIARRANIPLDDLASATADYRAGQTGLLRLAWDHGDRCILGDANLAGVTFGWKLHHMPQDELFAAIEGTAFHTRMILDRMSEHVVPIQRVIHAGGIPRKSPLINKIYASALEMPVLLPQADTTSLGSAIFAFLAAGTFPTVEAAQQALCPAFTTIEPEPQSVRIYAELFEQFQSLYYALGQQCSVPVQLGDLLPTLARISFDSLRKVE